MKEVLKQLRQIKWIDITRTLGSDNLDYPQDDPVEIKRIMEQERGDICNLTRICMSTHAGTHLDAPAHFLSGAAFLEEIPPERFVLEAKVVEIAGEKITAGELSKYSWEPGQGVLFKTSNSNLPRNIFSHNYVAMELNAAKFLVEKGIGMVGIDYLSVDELRSPEDCNTPGKIVPVHEELLKSGCLILEDVNLGEVEPGSYLLICLPLKYSRSEGAPCRCILGVRNNK